MPTLASKLNARSEDFKANAAAMRVLVDDLNAKLATIAQGGGEGPRAKHPAARANSQLSSRAADPRQVET